MDKFKEYKKSIDIDYYAYFTKAYFAFNAYLKAKYPSANDRDKIKNIKENHTVKIKFTNLINEGKHFKDDLTSLRNELNRMPIQNQEEFITFTKVKINEHQEGDIFKGKFNGVDYHIRAIPAEKFFFKVKTFPQTTPFKFEELDTQLNNSSLSSTQKSKVKLEIEEYVKRYSIDLTDDLEKLYKLELHDVVAQKEIIERVYKGFIEIIYSLRNALFHSEVEPNNDVMRIYKFAYFSLRKIIHEIPTS